MNTLEQQKKIASDNLAQAKEILDGLNIPFCLFLGTALGAYRDHDFCEDDVDDIDIGVRVDYFSRIEEIKKAFEDNGFREHHRFEHPKGIGPEEAFIKEYEGWHSKIDIFFYTLYKGKIAWVFYSDTMQIRTVSDYFADYDKVEFYGVEYNIPSPIESYLKENYGENWKTPIPRRNWVWDKDNKCPIE